MEIKLLKLWIGSLRACKPRVEPEAGHFDSLIEWLENYIETAEQVDELNTASNNALAEPDLSEWHFPTRTVVE